MALEQHTQLRHVPIPNGQHQLVICRQIHELTPFPEIHYLKLRDLEKVTKFFIFSPESTFG
jgi:hypothetical protein